jgi:hypothetical protein
MVLVSFVLISDLIVPRVIVRGSLIPSYHGLTMLLDPAVITPPPDA